MSTDDEFKKIVAGLKKDPAFKPRKVKTPKAQKTRRAKPHSMRQRWQAFLDLCEDRWNRRRRNGGTL